MHRKYAWLISIDIHVPYSIIIYIYIYNNDDYVLAITDPKLTKFAKMVLLMIQNHNF